MKVPTAPSLDNARAHYQEREAFRYEERRVHKAKWRFEHECVRHVLLSLTAQGCRTVLDVPVGTGRFLQLYKDLGLKAAGVDCSASMLQFARENHPDVVLQEGDVTKLDYADGEFDVVVCVRLLHLISPSEVPVVLHELMRVAKRDVLATIHLDRTAYVRGRSQVHVRAALAACVLPAWQLQKPIQIMTEKGVPYYMLHFRNVEHAVA